MVTRMNKRQIEQVVEEYLEERFQQSFTTTPRTPNSFNVISKDATVVAAVRIATLAWGNQIGAALEDADYLRKQPAEWKLLFITDGLSYELAWRYRAKKLLDVRRDGIEVISPIEFQAFIDRRLSQTNEQG